MYDRNIAKLRIKELQRFGQPCAVDGCYSPRQKLGKYCEYHDRVNERTGDPEGRTIRKAELAPYFKQALEVVEDHPHNKSITHMVEWIKGLLNQTFKPYRPNTPASRVWLWLYRMNEAGVKPEEVLAVVLGMYLLYEHSPRTFKTHRHFVHQLALRVFRLVPASQVRAWSSGRAYYKYDRVNVGMREYFGWFLVKNIGGHCLAFARHILGWKTFNK